jgi:hypothetical protein
MRDEDHFVKVPIKIESPGTPSRNAVEEFYPDGYDGPPDPHMRIEPVDRERRPGIWRCVDCGAEGPPEMIGKGGCAKEHKPCPYCGCAPVCAMDCSGIAELLVSPEVYLAGFGPPQ